MKIPVKEIEPYMSAEYRHGIYLPKSVSEAYFDCMLSGEAYVDAPDDWRETTEAAKADDELRESEYKRVSEHRVRGMQYEDIADNAGAISEYAVSIILGEQSKFNLFMAYAHSYERIIVCLHKAKDYEREAKYISQYIAHGLDETKSAKYSARLEKLKSKIK
ncbi:MAG: hypothetical protein NC044_05670 [Prevotella sp.]|nr:hypothetical protein [Bacteroides sp.]MCM1445876.1 hypothetical protein [Prevotella sp.]